MYDESSGDPGVFDFEELANHLLEQGLDSSPSQIHGCLCGLLAAGAPSQAEFGLDALTRALDLVLHGELAGRVLELYAVTAAALQDEEFSFHLLLPEDDEDIAVRTEAMAAWCKGFLAGFAQVSAVPERAGSALSQDSSEILKDVAVIAQAGVDDDEDEEDSEESYMELVEYLRMAVMNVYMEHGADSQTGNPDEQEPSLH